MGLSRSTFYDPPPVTTAPGEVLVRIKAICDEFECYGYRRVGAALRHQGVVVNNKKLRRLMKAHDLQPKQRRRYVVTTGSEHGGPIFPDLAKDVALERPNQLWVADPTYVAIPGGFVYLAAILAWSRKVVGFAISRSMEARIAVAALKSPSGSVSHPRAASTIPIEDPSMPRKPIARCLLSTAWRVR
jgi:putative transposase